MQMSSFHITAISCTYFWKCMHFYAFGLCAYEKYLIAFLPTRIFNGMSLNILREYVTEMQTREMYLLKSPKHRILNAMGSYNILYLHAIKSEIRCFNFVYSAIFFYFTTNSVLCITANHYRPKLSFIQIAMFIS